MFHLSLFRTALALALSLLFSFSISRADSGAEDIQIDIRKSLIVTELSILEKFPLKRTMNQLAKQTGIPGMTGEKMFRQWFDILNPRSEAKTKGPHCDDRVDPSTGVGILNTFPYTCRPASVSAEGLEAVLPTDPTEGYTPITLTSRLDLAPADGAHCGEYRIVYARNSGMDNIFNRNLLIFEAALPNPQPALGLEGCRKIVKYWARLSKEPSASKRAEALERFYYEGIEGCMPAVHIAHYGGNPLGAGQLRTNMFMQFGVLPNIPIWSLREFKLGVGGPLVSPVTVKTNPFGPLFKSAGSHPLTTEFQEYFLTQVEGLATSDFTFNYTVPDKFNAAQSQANASVEDDYVAQLGGDSSPFGQRIQAKLTQIGSTLTPTEIVARAQSLSCAGCHQLNSDPFLPDSRRSLGGGLIFPRSLGFTHASESIKEIVEGEEAWAISPVLTELLLPARKEVVIDYLNNRLKMPTNPVHPIGKRPHH